MSDETERIEGIKQYIDATITEIDNHTENMEKLFRMDKWSDDKELYEIIINSYERHRNTLKRIQKMICLLYTSPSPRDRSVSRMPSSA